MFRIGEFAQIAQVSTRRLRFYDEIGLLRPAHADQRSGYRYYSIRQLPRLNAILALQYLGLMLDQIGPLLEDAVSPAELRGMLLLKRAAAEQALRIEEQRLRHIESRIAQIDRQGNMSDYDVVTKTLPSLPILVADHVIDDLEEAGPLVAAAAAAGRSAIPETRRGNLIVIAENEVGSGRMNLSVGYTQSPTASRKLTAAGLTFIPRTLPAIEAAATLVRQGTNAESHTAFGAIGLWVEANGYVVTGPSREIFLEPVLEPPGFDRALVEIQFPIALA
ncbi:MAG: MerR family transcriptional regulator [Nitrospiraceae bacterium]|nr:MerR family transcriptional regulator [Nitrospiraceae bacterium]